MNRQILSHWFSDSKANIMICRSFVSMFYELQGNGWTSSSHQYEILVWSFTSAFSGSKKSFFYFFFDLRPIQFIIFFSESGFSKTIQPSIHLIYQSIHYMFHMQNSSKLHKWWEFRSISIDSITLWWIWK